MAIFKRIKDLEAAVDAICDHLNIELEEQGPYKVKEQKKELGFHG